MPGKSINFNDVGGNIYPYEPNKGAPVVLAVLFAATMVWHLIQIHRYKCWKMTLPLPWGALLFVAGFCIREANAYHDANLNLFITEQVLLVVAPPVYALANYLLLGRALYYVPYFSPIHPGRVLSTFVGLDVLVEILTGNGAALLANTSNSASAMNTGRQLLRASLLLQVGLFFLFITLEVTFHLRCRRAGVMSRNLQNIFNLLYMSSLIILTRNVYRVIEQWDYDHQPSKYLLDHEAFVYVFDATLMLINSLILNVWHPARYLPRCNTLFLARDGKTEVKGPGWVDQRAWWKTFIDPFDLAGLLKGRDNTKFWEGDGEWAVKARGEVWRGDGGASANAQHPRQ